MANSYYVYVLKDPRQTPALTFYVGKGTGSRATEHLKKVDSTRKGKYIQEVLNSGHSPLVKKVVDKLTEEQALRIEMELISCFGTVDTGGVLYNTVIPHSINRKLSGGIVVPHGAVEKAQLGLQLLKDSILSLSLENPAGITNSDCSHYLGLQSAHEGKQQDYLTYSVLGLLLEEGAIESTKSGNRRIYLKL